ncbi:hypothetical protein PIB30_015591 [Stylosanthes scabra]|uniref:Uncharacterized protein n=1 Tax=Stylosanthes scabra TaxID=79078 RepID=A0ABU6R7B2_9FABA|nr:hypothetical protein [Stylosanthes scabra]
MSTVHSQELNPEVPNSTENKNSNMEIRSVVLTMDGDVDDRVVVMKKEAETVTNGGGWVPNNAEDGVPAEEMRTPDEDSAEDSAVTVEGRRTYMAFEDGGLREKTGAATMADRGLRAQLLRRFILLTPPLLLAVVLPWNRGGDDEERSRDRWQRRAAASTRGDKRNLDELLSGTVLTGSWCYGAMQTTTGRREGAAVVESGSLFDFENGRHDPRLAGVELATTNGWWKLEEVGGCCDGVPFLGKQN